ncbi:MAG: riboflavin synthase [Gemmatimonadota bacterium]
MFTGLVDDVGTITAVEEGAAGREFRIACRYDDVTLGESIACQGVCLTVRECGAHWFTVAAVVTTLGRTTIATWQVGQHLNLERSLRVGDRLGGHIVQGHVDGVGEVLATAQQGDAWLIDIAVPPEIADLLVPHGSICVDGVSLTANAIPRPGVLQVSIIDFTLRHTTLGELATGDRVHLEGDVVGKYVRTLVAPYLRNAPQV